jgi:hypothetical protein
MGLIRSTLSLILLGCILLVGFTVPVGERTLFGHVANIWSSDEAQELVESVKDSSGPLVDRVKRGVEAGLAEEAEPSVDAQSEESTESEDDSVAITDSATEDADQKQ